MLAVVTLLASSPRARAAACPSDVALSGEAKLIASVEALLDERGIRVDPDAAARAESEGCRLVRAHVVRRAARYVVSIEVAGGDAVERRVGDLATAATVIESFVREDVASLLLDRQAPRQPRVARAPASPAPARSRGVHLFAAAESSLASDQTNWLGAHAGACLMLGPVCAAARLRVAYLLGGEDEVWERARRESKELLVGLDVPLSLGRVVLSPGLAAGLGAMHTETEDDGDEESLTGGLRVEVRVGLSIPVTERLAIDLSTALDLTQETYAESSQMLPDEPLALLRFGAGVRYGGL